VTARSRDPAHRPSSEALARYLVVSQVLAQQHLGLCRAAALAAVAAVPHPDAAGVLRRRCTRTLQRWLRDYEHDGLAGLEPHRRAPSIASRAVPTALVTFAGEQKRLDPAASLPELVRRARELGILTPEQPVDRTTLWRVCQRAGVELGRRKSAATRDSHRFAYPHRMDLVLCDGKHFRAGATRHKRVALFFLDDATRLGLHVVVGTSEHCGLFLRGLYELIRRHGFMSIVYLDRGPGFIADDTAEIIAKLGALLILGEGRYPEGHGKIERFNRSALAQVLRGFDRRPDVDADCGALELRLAHFLRELYNHAPHESLEQRTPFERFSADTRALRFPEDDAALRARFVVHLERRVTNDHVVSVDGVAYEVPRGHAGAKVVLHRRVLDGSLLVPHQGRLVVLHPVDLARNATTPRARPAQPDASTTHPLPPSAADLRFARDLRPVVGPDGGFSDPAPQTPEESP
jgi:putative transposase